MKQLDKLKDYVCIKRGKNDAKEGNKKELLFETGKNPGRGMKGAAYVGQHV